MEGKELASRKFITSDGKEILKACFCCVKKDTCEAKELCECEFEKPENVVLINDIGSLEEKIIKDTYTSDDILRMLKLLIESGKIRVDESELVDYPEIMEWLENDN